MNAVKKLSMTSGKLILTLFIISSYGSNTDPQTAIASSQNVEVISVSKVGISNMSDVVDGISYTTLKDHPQHRAYRIDKVLIENGLVYIFDYYSARSLSVYDLRGNFQFTVAQSGQGPDQYLEVQDFLVNQGEIEVLDAGSKLVIYNNKGVFKRSEKLPFIAQSFTKVDSNYLFQTGKIPNALGENGKSCELVEYDLETKNSDCVLEIHSGRNPHSFKERDVLKKIGSEFYYATYFNDTIYRKNGEKFTPRFILDFSSNALPD